MYIFQENQVINIIAFNVLINIMEGGEEYTDVW